MNWSTGFTIFAGLLIPMGLKADPITVLAGEHDRFTRLVMEMPPGTTWDLQGDSGEYKISVSVHSEGFDTSRTFSIIPRDRLASVSSGQSDLSLSLNCDCPVEAFEEQGGYLVIDVLDGPSLPTASNAAAQPANLPEPSTNRPQLDTAFQYGDLLWVPPGNDLETGDEAAEE